MKRAKRGAAAAAPIKAAAPAIHNSDAAPVVYFDAVAAMGVLNGVFKAETIQGCIIPVDGGRTKTRTVVTAHIRCSIPAALELSRCIQEAVRDEQARIEAVIKQQQHRMQASPAVKPASYPPVNSDMPAGLGDPDAPDAEDEV